LWHINSVTGDPIDFAEVPAGYATSQTDMLTFCLQLTESFGFGTPYSPVAVVTDLANSPDGPSGFSLGAVATAMIKWMWALHYDDIFAQGTSALRNLYAGAFQLAIWELEYDQPTTPSTTYFTSGDLTATGNQTIGSVSLFGLSKDWISEAITKYNTVGDTAPVSLAVLSKSNFQDQIVQYIPPVIPDVDPVPEPASVAIWLMIGAGLAYQHRRARRAGRASI
jgi:hypothetical protein